MSQNFSDTLFTMESSIPTKTAQSTEGEDKAGGKIGKTNEATIDPAIKELCSTEEIEALYKKLSVDEVSLIQTPACASQFLFVITVIGLLVLSLPR